jgi:hypothetical protein
MDNRALDESAEAECAGRLRCGGRGHNEWQADSTRTQRDKHQVMRNTNIHMLTDGIP